MPLPDPSGAPAPVVNDGKLNGAFKQGVTVVVSGGILLFLLSCVLTPTMGGKRTARLKWQEQQRHAQDEISKAIQAEGATHSNHE
jgi:hypothetical protein